MDEYRYVTLTCDDGQLAVVGVDPDDGRLVAVAGGDYIIFRLPRLAAEAADIFRRQGWRAEVCRLPRY